MESLGSLLLLIGILWGCGVVFVATCMGIVKALEILENNHD